MTTNTEPEKKTAASEPVAEDKRPHGGFAYWKICLIIFLAFLVLDQATKFWAVQSLKPDYYDGLSSGTIESITIEQYMARPLIKIIPGVIEFDYAENRGAAWSILEGRRGLLTAISVIASVLLFFFWKTLPAGERIGRIAVALILSGAVGNLIDRARQGAVVDFIDTYIFGYDYPTFNIADSCIFVGACMLIMQFLRKKI